jgi:hypothetical protein
MYDSKLIHIFQKFSAEEHRQLKKWIVSPFANIHEDVIKLMEFLYSRKAISTVTTQKTRAFEYLFPKKKYDDLRLRHIMSLTTQILEAFIIYFHYQKSETHRLTALSQFYNQHNLSLYAEQTSKNIQQYLIKQPKRNSQYYYEIMQTEINDFILHSKNVRDKPFNIQTISDAIHHYTYAEILKYACVGLSHTKVSSMVYSFPMLSFIIHQVDNNFELQAIPTQLYYLIYKASSVIENEMYFESITNLLAKHESCFSDQELKDIFIFVINLCIRRINDGNKLFAATAYNLYHQALQKNYLIENGELSRFTFTNIVFAGLYIQNFKGTETFIKNYQQYIHADYREHVVAFNLARLYFTKKNYKKAMPILLTVEFKDDLQNLAAKFMLLKIYFETREFEAMLALCNSFKVYLHRQKKIGYHKIRYKNVLNFIDKLYQHIGAKRDEVIKLKNEIQLVDNLPDKDWFIEQLATL